MADGPVYTRIEWEEDGADPTEKTIVRKYCGLDGSDFDDELKQLFDAAKRTADRYLNNPFKELVPTIVFSGVTANDYIVVNGQQYTAADEADEDDLYFAVGDSDSDTADNFVALVNSTTLGGSYGTVGVEGVTASNASGTVTLSRDYENVDDIVVTSSDEDTLMVRQVWTNTDIPEEVNQWIHQYIARNFHNPEAVMQTNVAGVGGKMYVSMKSEESGMKTNFGLISFLRIPVGF